MLVGRGISLGGTRASAPDESCFFVTSLLVEAIFCGTAAGTCDLEAECRDTGGSGSGSVDGIGTGNGAGVGNARGATSGSGEEKREAAQFCRDLWIEARRNADIHIRRPR